MDYTQCVRQYGVFTIPDGNNHHAGRLAGKAMSLFLPGTKKYLHNLMNRCIRGS
jgi:hypothetical protein